MILILDSIHAWWLVGELNVPLFTATFLKSLELILPKIYKVSNGNNHLCHEPDYAWDEYIQSKCIVKRGVTDMSV
jgi:hypothetical protein